MEKAVWLTLQTHMNLRPTAAGYIPPDVAACLWTRLQPFFVGDPEMEARKGTTSRPRPTRVGRMPRWQRAQLDAQKAQRREDFFRRGFTYEGGPILDPAYEGWLINHGHDPARYLSQFDAEDGWEAPPWAAKYGVIWPGPGAWDNDLDAAQDRELVTA